MSSTSIGVKRKCTDDIADYDNDYLQVKKFLAIGRWNDLIPSSGMSSLDMDKHASKAASTLGFDERLDLDSFDDIIDCFSVIDSADIASLTNRCNLSRDARTHDEEISPDVLLNIDFMKSIEECRVETCVSNICEEESTSSGLEGRCSEVDMVQSGVKQAKRGFYESDLGDRSFDCVSFCC